MTVLVDIPGDDDGADSSCVVPFSNTITSSSWLSGPSYSFSVPADHNSGGEIVATVVKYCQPG